MSKWIVAKFGGTSMGTIESMSRCAKIVANKRANIVVVSATSGTTNQLVELTELSQTGQWENCEEIIGKIRDRHLSMLAEVSAPDTSKEKLETFLRQLTTLVKGCSLLQECSPKAYDGIVSKGELMSSLIFSHVLEKEVSSAAWFDSREILSTDGAHNKALPQFSLIENNCREHFQNVETTYIGQGFIGRGPDGSTTTLGRGGSDYSAALYAEGIHASELQIWTDVPGMASTDPRLCPDAKSIQRISFKEAAEMATFGAKILHPATLAPAIRKEIPVFVGSTFAPNEPGTVIEKDVEAQPTVRAITVRRNQALLTLSNPRMLNASGFLRKIFEIFDHHQVSVDAITTSEISVAVTIDRGDLPQCEKESHFVNDLKELGKVEVEDNLSLVALIGNKIPGTPGLGENIFKSLDGINVRMITQGASQHNFCFLVNDHDADNAVKQLHGHFIN
jgi:aspartate kinase